MELYQMLTIHEAVILHQADEEETFQYLEFNVSRGQFSEKS